MRNGLLILLIIVILFITGCRPTPSTTLIHNKDSDDNIQTNETDEGEPREVTRSTVDINDTIELDNRIVTISGQAIVPDSYEGLYSYNFTKQYDSYEEQMMFLFGEYEKYAKVYEIPLPDGSIARMVEVRMDEEEYWAQISGGNYFGVNLYVMYEDEVHITMSHEESLIVANEILERIGVTEYIYTETTEEDAVWYMSDDTKLWLPEFRRLFYYCYLQNIPVKVRTENLYTIPSYSVNFFSEGIYSVSIDLATYEKGQCLEGILTLDDVMGILEGQLSLSKFDEIETISKIEFAYGGKSSNSESKEYLVVPFWQITTNAGNIIIDATTGKVEF